jgi:hypothetical protein
LLFRVRKKKLPPTARLALVFFLILHACFVILSARKCALPGWIMLAPTDVLNKKRELLKIKRDLLFEKFIDHPNDYRFALEIKTMDDEIADYTCRIEREVRRAFSDRTRL